VASISTYTSCRLSFGVELLGRFVESLVEMHTTQFRKFRLLGKSRKGSQTLEIDVRKERRSGGAEGRSGGGRRAEGGGRKALAP
jgi:hypothetical protein